MEYKQKIESVIDRYFNGALAEYREAVMAAMEAGKKLPIFRKVDFSGHIERFQGIRKQGEELLEEADSIEVPETDEMYQEVLHLLEISLKDFV